MVNDDLTTDDLTTRLSRVRPGDWVRVKHVYNIPDVEGTVHEAEGALWVQGARLRHPNGHPGSFLADLLEHRPASLTAEQLNALPKGSIVRDFEGDLWVLAVWPDGEREWVCRWSLSDDILDYAPLTLVRERAAR